MEQGDVVYLKVFDKLRGDVVFEGKVSTDVEPHELANLRCFWERSMSIFYRKASHEQVTNFKGLQSHVELVAISGHRKHFSGVLYVGADDGVLRTSVSVPSSECVMMTLWTSSHEECKKVSACEALGELEFHGCYLREVPKDIGKMKKLKTLRLEGLYTLKSIPEEIGELSNLEELQIGYCEIECLPKRLKELKMLKSINLVGLDNLQLNADDLVVFSKLKHLTILRCSKVLAPSFTQLFWETIKSSTDLRVLELNWYLQDQKMFVAALKENGSIVDGGKSSDSYAKVFQRNKENHERARESAVHMLAIRRWRNALNGVPKEMVRMIGMMLWNTKCDVGTWSKDEK